jgi:hypothetical protein
MEDMKKLIKLSMKMLSEADSYASMYYECKMKDHIQMADLYYKMAQLHLDGYQQVKTMIASHLNTMKREDPHTVMPEVVMMVREVESDLYTSIQEKLKH